MMFSGGPSLADIAAVTGNNNRDNGGFGDSEGWWVLIILFALFGGWGNNGYGGNGGGTSMQGALTRGDLCMDMNFNGLENAVGRISDNQAAIARQTDNAICNVGYNEAQLANGIQMQIGNEFRGLDNAICNLGHNVLVGQNALATQLAQCCCDQKAEAAQTRFDMQQGFCNLGNLIQTTTRDIIDNQNAQYLRQLENENQALRLSASQEAQNQYLVNQLRPCPQPAYITCNPWAAQAPYGSCSGVNSCC